MSANFIQGGSSNIYKYLGQYRFLRVRIKNIENKIKQLEQQAFSVNSSSVVITDNDRSKNSIEAKTGEPRIYKLIELKDEYLKLIHEAEITCLDIESKIKEIEEELPRNILFLYFCCNASFEQIAVELHYSYDWIRKVFYRKMKQLNKEQVKEKAASQ